MTALVTLASELGEKTLWDPTILGVLVFASAVVLFCGSVYLLIATNVGARQGFLIAAAALTGTMVMLSLIWYSTATPLNSPRGASPSWEPVETAATNAQSSIDAVQSIESDGTEIAEAQFAEIRPAVDAALVVPSAEGEEVEVPELAIVGDPSDIIILRSWQTGGDARWVFWHEPLYQSVEFCRDDDGDDDVPFGEVAPEPVCDPEAGTQVVVFERDLGTLRQPPAFFLIGSSILFGLSLLGLHWREKDQRAREAAETAEASS